MPHQIDLGNENRNEKEYYHWKLSLFWVLLISSTCWFVTIQTSLSPCTQHHCQRCFCHIYTILTISWSVQCTLKLDPDIARIRSYWQPSILLGNLKVFMFKSRNIKSIGQKTRQKYSKSTYEYFISKAISCFLSQLPCVCKLHSAVVHSVVRVTQLQQSSLNHFFPPSLIIVALHRSPLSPSHCLFSLLTVSILWFIDTECNKKIEPNKSDVSTNFEKKSSKITKYFHKYIFELSMYEYSVCVCGKVVLKLLPSLRK